MRKIIASVLILFAAFTLANCISGCAARRAEARSKLPIADSVCVQLVGLKEPEQALVARKVAGFLRMQGFRPIDSDCDVNIVFTALDGATFEVKHTLAWFSVRSKPAYRVEGVVSVSARGGRILEQDETVNLRDYSSKAELLDDLALAIITYVPTNYRPLSQPTK